MHKLTLDKVRETLIAQVTIDKDGNTLYSLQGLASLCGVTKVMLYRHFSAEGRKSSALCRMLRSQGVKDAQIETFAQYGVPDKAVLLTLAYYVNTNQNRLSKSTMVSKSTLTQIKRIDPDTVAKLQRIMAKNWR